VVAPLTQSSSLYAAARTCLCRADTEGFAGAVGVPVVHPQHPLRKCKVPGAPGLSPLDIEQLSGVCCLYVKV